MTTSVFDLFKVGIGPSSSHTVGPMRAARQFAQELRSDPRLGSDTTLRIELFGSLAATGRGHGTLTAVMLGLEGHHPETIDPDEMPAHLSRIRGTARLRLNGTHAIAFNEEDHIALHALQRLPTHPNGMRFTAVAGHGAELLRRTYFSIGGGAIVDEHATDAQATERAIPYPFGSARELLEHARRAQLPISGIMLANEQVDRTQRDVRHGLLLIWHTMQSCMHRGCAQEGQLPGGLGVERRAAAVRRSLESRPDPQDPLLAMDWVSLWALAVNEENAAGGRVVTAPTNGAAGIVPAVLQYYEHFVPAADDEGVVRFLLTAGAIGTLYKRNASISGAEVGCQGEVGSACSMAAAGLAEVLGGTPGQVEQAAEIGMEHNLGLTCDPIGGLVQIPCIERNALASINAIAAARLALRGDGRHRVSLDDVIKTMRDTGADMSARYKETAMGGLAVNLTEC